MMPPAVCALCTHLAGLCAILRAQRQIRSPLRRSRNTTSSPRLVISIYPHNTPAATNRVPPPRARFVAASLVHRAPRRVVRQVRLLVVQRVPLPLCRFSVWCVTRVCIQTQ